MLHFSGACWNFGAKLLTDLFQLKPGLSAYPTDPRQAANSLVSLLDKAESSVPRELRPKTPVRVGVWKRVVIIFVVVYFVNYLKCFYSLYSVRQLQV